MVHKKWLHFPLSNRVLLRHGQRKDLKTIQPKQIKIIEELQVWWRKQRNVSGTSGGNFLRSWIKSAVSKMAKPPSFRRVVNLRWVVVPLRKFRSLFLVFAVWCVWRMEECLSVLSTRLRLLFKRKFSLSKYDEIFKIFQKFICLTIF